MKEVGGEWWDYSLHTWWAENHHQMHKLRHEAGRGSGSWLTRVEPDVVSRCASWHAIPLTTVVVICVTYVLPVSANQSYHPLLITCIDKVFPPAELLLTGFLFFFQFLKCTSQPVERQNPCHDQSHWGHILFVMNFSWSSWVVAAWFDALHPCQMISMGGGWV